MTLFHHLPALLLAGLAGAWAVGAVAAPAAAPRPNVLLILADDLGWSDLGCYGGEIRTPHLDGLARKGVRFTQFYNSGRCWPTRAALMTGYYPQQVRRDTVPGIASGGGGRRPAWAPLLPERLRPLGYRSYHSGKWHLDGPRLAGGFDRSYSLEDHDRYFDPRSHLEDDVRLPPVAREDGAYVTALIADHAIRCLQDHARRFPGQPFFHYLCFTAPHFPLQAPEADIARYREAYRRGWDVVREERARRVRSMGLFQGGLPAVERNLGPPYAFPEALKTLGAGETNRPVPWAELSEAQREFQAVKMAIHAAMVEAMDREIGRVLAQVRAMGAWENTLIVFLSDNGASAEIMVRGDGHDPHAPPGGAGSYLCLGPGWSTVANTPFRRHKTWTHEGGIATPFIAHWPAGLRGRGRLRHTPGHAVDLAPTILELAGGTWTNAASAGAAPPPSGRSLALTLKRGRPVEREFLWWLHEGHRALRAGDWKLVASSNEDWELYDLKADRGETRNLASQHPEKVEALARLWRRQTDLHYAQAREAPRGP